MINELLAIGADNARTAKELSQILNCDARMITIQVERERRAGYPICASCTTPKGYYLAANEEDLESYCGRLHHRAAELYKTRQALLTILQQIRDTHKPE